MTGRRRPQTTPAQAVARRDLRRLAAAGSTPLANVTDLGLVGDDLVVRLRLRTDTIHPVPCGLPVDPSSEDVVVVLTADFPWVPPLVGVEHGRFAGHPHVLTGTGLCVYLDPTQEWHPTHGITGFLSRLWTWFEDAAAGRFDPHQALYHPVGGITRHTAGTPTIVVRDELGHRVGPFGRAWLRERTRWRLDLLTQADADGGLEALVVAPGGPLWYSAGITIGELCAALARVGSPKPTDFLWALASTALRNPPSSAAYFLLAVPPSELAEHTGGHLVCGRLPGAVADALRAVARRHGPLVRFDPAGPMAGVGIEWCPVSEERQSMTIRRDNRRPITAFAGTHVVLWGCGGLGSWAGEFLARAGVRRLTLCDPYPVTGGLLVRQDYSERDIGATKADALAGRLAALRDDLAVDVTANAISTLAGGTLPNCDVLIDATVNNAVAAALGAVWATTTVKPLVARIATDRATATLGLLTVGRPGAGPTPEEADLQTGDTVSSAPALEVFRSFWETPDPSDEITPAPGCSVPTYHGSAADLAALAATLTSLLGPHLPATRLAGSHLVALPHSYAGAAHHWVDLDPAGT